MSQTLHDSAAARLRLAGDGFEAGYGPLATDAPPVEDPCDALADLFMSGGGYAPESLATPMMPAAASRLGPGAANARIIREEPVALTRPHAAPVEAMVLGHLPVLASAWGPQFARFVAAGQAPEPARPVALVRFRAGSLSIEVFGSSSHHESTAPPESDWGEAVARASRLAARWLVSVDATGEPELADLVRSRQIAGLTLLTGADEAATVACYRTIKALLGPDSGLDTEPLPVRIAVMGAHDGAEAGERLARATEAFLGFRPTVVHAGGRIEPAPAMLVFRGAADADLDDVLVAIGRTHAPEASGRGAGADRLSQVPPAEAIPEQRGPIVGPGANHASDLIALFPGARALPLRCPHAREVQFAADAAGSLHVLAWDDSAAEPPVASIAAAGAWAVLNGELVASACPGVASPTDRAPVQHLFTRDARRLRGLLDTSVKVHLVLAAPQGATTMVAGELN